MSAQAKHPNLSSRLWAKTKGVWGRLTRWAEPQIGHPNAGSYTGAAENRLTNDWIFAHLSSADAEIRGDIKKLRMRARELARNNEHITRFLNLLEENVVGHQGIRLQAKIKNPFGELDNPTNARIEAAWNDWSRADTASADGRLSFRGLLSLAQQTEAQDGEYLIRMLPGFRNR